MPMSGPADVNADARREVLSVFYERAREKIRVYDLWNEPMKDLRVRKFYYKNNRSSSPAPFDRLPHLPIWVRGLMGIRGSIKLIREFTPRWIKVTPRWPASLHQDGLVYPKIYFLFSLPPLPGNRRESCESGLRANLSSHHPSN
jgi:hypothetical protein